MIEPHANLQPRNRFAIEFVRWIALSWVAMGCALLPSFGTPQEASNLYQERENRQAASPAKPSPSATPIAPLPSFNSPQLDQQIRTYQRYLAANGRPDFLIVGSSRALQGVDPIALEKALAELGHSNRRVYNFSINGSTAQVVAFKLEQLLLPEQLPRMIIWADGARAVNSGRRDRTFANILNSPGYRQLQRQHQSTTQSNASLNAPTEPAPTPADPWLETQGFRPIVDVFEPKQYFQKFPRVSGRYDADYHNFSLTGIQDRSLREIIKTTRDRKIPIIFVNLPLTDLYLDSTRHRHEQQFRRYFQGFANQGLLTFIDLNQQPMPPYSLFADPSHLNRQGAIAVAESLGQKLATYLDRLQGKSALLNRNMICRRTGTSTNLR
ncbi:MAG: hypothetical protein VKJ24_16575 [Synechococcales bacterium]|nr:hypothetical protein [Synechococcales bacterium]